MNYRDNLVDYKDFKLASKGRKLLVLLADYFLLLIICFGLFCIATMPIFNALPIVNNVETSYQTSQDALLEMVADTKLQSINSSTGRLVSVSSGAESYLLTLVKTSCYINGDDYNVKQDGQSVTVEVSLSDTFLATDSDGNYINDNIAYYFLSYRPNHREDYQTESSITTREAINNTFLDYNGVLADYISDSFNESEDVLCLNSDTCNRLMAYINFDDSAGSTIYTNLANAYSHLISIGINDIENNYSPYLLTFANFQKDYLTYIQYYDVAMILTYVVSFLVAYLVFPLCFKRGRTIGYKFFSFGTLRTDESEMDFVHYLIKDILLFIEQFSILFFVPLFLGKLDILTASFIGGLSLFQFVLFSFLLSVLSLLYMLITRDGKTLSELASDSEVHDLSKPLDRKEKSVYGRK